MAVRKWLQEAEEALEGYSKATDRIALCQPHRDNINFMTKCVTDYINFFIKPSPPEQ